MNFEENWLKGHRGEVVQRCEQMDGQQLIASDHNSSSWALQ